MNTDESLTIVLRLPPKNLSPNRPPASKRGRMAKAKAAEKYKKEAKEAVLAEGIETGPWQHATVSALFYHKTNRRRDPDNAMASLKPAYDGLTEAGLLVDDDSEHLSRCEPQFFIDQETPRVEIKVSRDG